MRKIPNLTRQLFTITLTTVAQLAELAERTDKSKSEVIRDLVEQAWNTAQKEEATNG